VHKIRIYGGVLMSLLVIGEDPTRLKSINKLSLSEKHLGEVEWVHAWIK
jgi:hypothetical protein